MSNILSSLAVATGYAFVVVKDFKSIVRLCTGIMYFFRSRLKTLPRMLQVVVKEEERLAAALADIEQEARIVPRGSFVKTPTGQVYENRSFEGDFCILLF